MARSRSRSRSRSPPPKRRRSSPGAPDRSEARQSARDVESGAGSRDIPASRAEYSKVNHKEKHGSGRSERAPAHGGAAREPEIAAGAGRHGASRTYSPVAVKEEPEPPSNRGQDSHRRAGHSPEPSRQQSRAREEASDRYISRSEQPTRQAGTSGDDRPHTRNGNSSRYEDRDRSGTEGSRHAARESFDDKGRHQDRGKSEDRHSRRTGRDRSEDRGSRHADRDRDIDDHKGRPDSDDRGLWRSGGGGDGRRRDSSPHQALLSSQRLGGCPPGDRRQDGRGAEGKLGSGGRGRSAYSQHNDEMPPPPSRHREGNGTHASGKGGPVSLPGPPPGPPPRPGGGGRGDGSQHHTDNHGEGWGTAAGSAGGPAQEAPPPVNKEAPNLGLSGKLAAETNKVGGTELKHQPPPDARKPDKRWRLYVFKNETLQPDPYYLHKNDHYLLGRDQNVVDIVTAHPSLSKQHAVLQFRYTDVQDEFGLSSFAIRPYMMDLGSVNGTFLNSDRIEPLRFYELREQDTIKLGMSTREYVLLHDKSAAAADA